MVRPPEGHPLGELHNAFTADKTRRQLAVDDEKASLRRDHVRLATGLRAERVRILGAVSMNQIRILGQDRLPQAQDIGYKQRGRAELVRRGHKVHVNSLDFSTEIMARPRNLHHQSRVNVGMLVLGKSQIENPPTGMKTNTLKVWMIRRQRQIAKMYNSHSFQIFSVPIYQRKARSLTLKLLRFWAFPAVKT